MEFLKRLVALFLALTALTVFFNLILTPAYHDGSSDYPSLGDGSTTSWPSGVILALARQLRSARRAADGADYLHRRKGHVGQPILPYTRAIALAMLFFWQYLWLHVPRQRDRRCRYSPTSSTSP